MIQKQIHQCRIGRKAVRKLLITAWLILQTFVIQAQTFEWVTAAPQTQGFSAERLNTMLDSLKQHATEGLVVIRNDTIVMEWYAKGWSAGKPHGTASLAKALVGGMSLAVALQDGRMKPDDPAALYIPEWQHDPVKSKITIRELATHTSGMDDAEVTITDANGKETDIPHMEIPGWAGDFWRQSPDPFSVAKTRAPIVHQPGTIYSYSNPGMAMLSYAVTASYRNTKYTDIRQLLWERIYKPIGIRQGEWSVGYDKTFNTDGLKLVANWGGAAFTPRATARIGRLMLHDGNWQGTQLIDSSWIEKMTHYAGMPMERDKTGKVTVASGLCWYTNATGTWPHAPRDTYYGSGANNQHLIVIPSLHIIVVRYGRDMHDAAKGQSFHYGTEHYLVNLLMDALVQPPYPMSKLIKGVQFSPESTITHKACDSDNWPLTWADDDAMYTAYGDGSGFDPKVPQKLSLGFAKITGDAENFNGINIRSATGEQTGHGRTGKKASGMLMVKGVLYLWLRNADHDGKKSQLAWSGDHGKTWQYCQWGFAESFGCPVFLNFGKNYSNARDGYVYIYSHDETDAYKIADQMVMARVPIDKMRQRDAYEFFKGMNRAGHALWTKELKDRKPVFINPAGCYRNSISYNAGLKRYIWCQTLEPVDDHTDARFSGGLGIFEATAPWGPWYTVYYTKDWDTGPGETSSFPTKWISGDGKTCYLVFSGNDCFSVRKTNFLLADISAQPKTSRVSGKHRSSR